MSIQVYTANVGKHDPVCHIDDGTLLFTEDLLGDPLLSARRYKILAHKFVPDCDWSIWIDANVFLNVEPTELVDMCGLSDFGVFAHYHRTNIVEEAKIILDFKMDTKYNVYKILGSSYPKPQYLAQTMVLVRKNNDANIYRNNAWWNLLCQGSLRDQLSFPFFYHGPYWETVDYTKPNQYFTRIA